MEATRSQFVLKLLPSFADFAFLMPIAFLFGTHGRGRRRCWAIATRAGISAPANGFWPTAAVPAQDIFSFSKAGRALVCLGMAVGRAVRLAECASAVCSAVVLFAIAADLRHVRRCCFRWCGVSPTRSSRSGRHHARRGGLFDPLAGAAAPVHAVVPGALLRGAGARPRRAARRICGLPYLALFPVGDRALDQPARRVLRRHPDDLRLRRRRISTVLFSPDVEQGGRRPAPGSQRTS